jgi:hypothetical protein
METAKTRNVYGIDRKIEEESKGGDEDDLSDLG